MDLPIIINDELPISIRRQLTNALCDAIKTGRLEPGQAVPSTRELARSLNISRDTVLRNYNDLISQGFFEAKSGGGTFVSCNPLLLESSDFQQRDDQRPDDNKLSTFASQFYGAETELAMTGDLDQLNYSAAPADLLPVKQWRQLLSQHCSPIDPYKLDYGAEVFGHRPLREQICYCLRRSKALKCDPEQIIVFSDSQTPLDFVIRMLVKPGDPVILENPCYIGAQNLLTACGAQIHSVSVDEDGLVIDELKQLREHYKLAYVTPSHHDPTGAVMPLSRRKELLLWARDHCDFIIEDGFDSDYFYATSALPALHGLDQTNKVFYIYSFWQTLYPLVATGCLVIPPQFITTFRRAKRNTNRNFSIIEHYVLADFIREGHLERYLHKTKTIYKKRRQALIFALKQFFGSKVILFKESGGFHITVRFDLPLSTEEILDCAKSVDMPMISTSDYYMKKAVEREFLISFAVIPESNVSALVRRFAQALGC